MEAVVAVGLFKRTRSIKVEGQIESIYCWSFSNIFKQDSIAKTPKRNFLEMFAIQSLDDDVN